MPKRNSTKIASIFGQIEGVVADAMAAEGKCHRIAPEMIPETARFADDGMTMAHCALVFTHKTEAEFNQRVASLRA